MNIILLDEVNSTNSWAKANIDILKDGDIVIADIQTAGRGRFDRTWVSNNPQNLYMSLVLKPEGDFLKLPLANLTQYLSVVTAKVIENYAPEAKISAQIKWPNDILVKEKKIAGILAETTTQKGVCKGIILGLGLNLNMTLDEVQEIDKPTTALNLELSTAQEIDKNVILAQIRNEFFTNYEDFLEIGFGLIKRDYINRAIFLNKSVCAEILDKKICGIAKSVNDDGELVLIDANNKEKTITTGDITWN